jgi:four helix bundle protein
MRLRPEFRQRTKSYAAGVIRCFVKLPKSQEEVRILGRQLLRSGTSVAAHVREACRARSDAEFLSKLGGAMQEADESSLWLELLREECGITPTLTRPLENESSELIAIFTTMMKRTEEKAESRKLKAEIASAKGESRVEKQKAESRKRKFNFCFLLFPLAAVLSAVSFLLSALSVT